MYNEIMYSEWLYNIRRREEQEKKLREEQEKKLREKELRINRRKKNV